MGRRLSIYPALCFILTALSLASCAIGPPLPPLLAHASAGGGSTDVCPQANVIEGPPQGVALALSPQLNARLLRQFPPGTDSREIVSTLLVQRFSLAGVCNTDDTIHIAIFNQNSSIRLMWATHAVVYWKVDVRGRIVWTKGFVEYAGL